GEWNDQRDRPAETTCTELAREHVPKHERHGGTRRGVAAGKAEYERGAEKSLRRTGGLIPHSQRAARGGKKKWKRGGQERKNTNAAASENDGRNDARDNERSMIAQHRHDAKYIDEPRWPMREHPIAHGSVEGSCVLLNDLRREVHERVDQ